MRGETVLEASQAVVEVVDAGEKGVATVERALRQHRGDFVGTADELRRQPVAAAPILDRPTERPRPGEPDEEPRLRRDVAGSLRAWTNARERFREVGQLRLERLATDPVADGQGDLAAEIVEIGRLTPDDIPVKVERRALLRLGIALMPSRTTRESARLIASIAAKMRTRLVIERCDRSFAARRGPRRKERDITERAHDAGEGRSGRKPLTGGRWSQTQTKDGLIRSIYHPEASMKRGRTIKIRLSACPAPGGALDRAEGGGE